MKHANKIICWKTAIFLKLKDGVHIIRSAH